MAEEKKRFPWWLVVVAAALVPLAAALGIIETVGRQGTIIGAADRIQAGMSHDRVWSIIGPPVSSDIENSGWSVTEGWLESPITVQVTFQGGRVSTKDVGKLPSDPGEHIRWHFRRWAERAYTAIHGPRR